MLAISENKVTNKILWHNFSLSECSGFGIIPFLVSGKCFDEETAVT